MLELRAVSKRFGGVVATDEVTLEIVRGEVHALIGPNGAGKTTLIGQISGVLATDSGRILFNGADITRLSAHARVAAGLARSYQITSIFRRYSVLEKARSGTSFRFWRPVTHERALFDDARAIGAEIGLQARLSTVAATLAHGEQRALEVGLALATRPRLVLLDEPMAGMGPQESRAIIELIQRMRSRVTVLLVEHDMDAVFRLADRITVLVSGRVIASGAPAAIRADPAVRQAYLGEELAA